MFGFAIAIACAAGLIVLSRARRQNYFRRTIMAHVLARLDASPAQERALREIFLGLSREASAFRQRGRNAAQELGSLFSADRLTGDNLDEWLGARASELHPLRERVKAALIEAHGLFDTRQREILARLMAQGLPSYRLGGFHSGCGYHHHHLSPSCAC